jgi:hypothetical protein
MEQTGPIADAREAFEKFISIYLHSEDDSLLQEWLRDWLLFGNGVEYTGRNYETYLRVALDIADATMRGEISFDYCGTENIDAFPRTIRAIHDPDGLGAHYADRAEYEVAVCRWEHQGRGILTEDNQTPPPPRPV